MVGKRGIDTRLFYLTIWRHAGNRAGAYRVELLGQ